MNTVSSICPLLSANGLQAYVHRNWQLAQQFDNQVLLLMGTTHPTHLYSKYLPCFLLHMDHRYYSFSSLFLACPDRQFSLLCLSPLPSIMPFPRSAFCIGCLHIAINIIVNKTFLICAASNDDDHDVAIALFLLSILPY